MIPSSSARGHKNYGSAIVSLAKSVWVYFSGCESSIPQIKVGFKLFLCAWSEVLNLKNSNANVPILKSIEQISQLRQHMHQQKEKKQDSLPSAPPPQKKRPQCCDMLAKCWEWRCWPKWANLCISHPSFLQVGFPSLRPPPPPKKKNVVLIITSHR